MPEPDPIDRLLRRSLAVPSAPALSPDFERRLTQRIQPRRLNPKARTALTVYALFGLTASVGAMAASGMDLWLIALAIVAPIAAVAALLRPFFRR